MCDWFKPDTSAAQAAAARAREESILAMKSQLDARVNATAAADTGSESARLANEAALRRLAAGGMFGVGTGQQSAPSVATRQLMGD